MILRTREAKAQLRSLVVGNARGGISSRKSLRASPSRVDPTQTGSLRRRMIADLNRRFARLNYEIYKLIVEEDAFGLLEPVNPILMVGNSLATNAGVWKFLDIGGKIAAFGNWIRGQLQQQFLQATDDALWEEYVKEGFRKGAGRSLQDVLRKRGIVGTAADLLRLGFGQPEAVEKVKYLVQRTLGEIEGVTGDAALKLTRTLADGLVMGQHPKQIAKTLKDVVEVSKTRAEAIAQTEIIRAHAGGQIIALKTQGVTKVGVAVEWDVTDDNKLCPKCKAMDGVVFSIEEAEGLIPRHPRCRCRFIPANVGEDTTGQKRTYESIREAIRKSRKKDKGSDWLPRISKVRPKSLLDD